jgi:hypothetical protein
MRLRLTFTAGALGEEIKISALVFWDTTALCICFLSILDSESDWS